MNIFAKYGLAALAGYAGTRAYQRGDLNQRGQRVPLGALRVEAEPDVIVFDDGRREARVMGRVPTGMRKKASRKKTGTKKAEIKIKRKKYSPSNAPGMDAEEVTVLTAGTRTITLDGLASFRAKRWEMVQKSIIEEETVKGPARWKALVGLSKKGATLPTLRNAYGRWLITQRFKLAGIRPDMPIEQLYASVTLAVPGTKKATGFPTNNEVSFSTIKLTQLKALIKKHARSKGGVPLPSINSNPYAMPLLSVSDKVIKGVKQGYWTGVMYLAPSTEAGFNVCAKATSGCAEACLGHSTGQLRGEVQRIRRIRRTLHHVLFPASFTGQLLDEISQFRVHALGEGLTPAIRLNGSSDIPWELPKNGNIPSRFPDLQMYDYTKLDYKARRGAFQRKLPNGNWQYHLTYSWSEAEDAWDQSQAYLAAGGNVAVVVGGATSFKEDNYFYTPPEGKYDDKGVFQLRPYKASSPNPKAPHQNAARAFIRYCNQPDRPVGGYAAISGDEDDARFLDPERTWVVLYSKGGDAARDRTGFVVRVTPNGVPTNMQRAYTSDMQRIYPFRGQVALRYGTRAGRRSASQMMNWYEASLNRIC